MSKTIRIGELSRRSGRSIHAIRWYETQGLMPGVARDSAGRRIYEAHHAVWLELLDRLRLTGMTIAEMRSYARVMKEGRPARPRLREMLVAHAARSREKIDRQQEALRFIERKIDFYDEWIASGMRPPLPKLGKSRL